MMTLSLAISKSSMSTRRLFLRAANSAASLTRLARSAPEKPGVPRAMMSAFTSGASGTLRMCTSRICSRPRMSGSGTTTWRSKRPGRMSAGSSTSGRLVAAITITPMVLVQRLLALVVAAAEARAALAADRVDLVDEDDAGSVLLRLLEHVAHARGADADEHLDEVGTGNREERHFRLASDGAREQRLAGTGVADHQHAARDAPAQLLELGGITQEIDQLGDFLLRLLAARDVGEGHGVGGFVQHARARLAEAEGAAATAALHLAHEEDPHADQQQHREPGDEDLHEHRLLFFGLGRYLDAVLHQVAHHPDVVQAG